MRHDRDARRGRHPRRRLGRAQLPRLLRRDVQVHVPEARELPRLGGYKKSGIGRETHKMMLEHYQQTKNLLVSYSPRKLGFF